MEPEKNERVDDLVGFGESILREIGEEALRFYGKGDTNLRFDENLVTEAEIHLTDCFRGRVDSRFPEHRVFLADSLESGYSHHPQRYLWIFDPLDGVDNFQSGIPIWSMSLALLENYWPIFGMVHMPATGEFFQATAGGKALRGSQTMRIGNSTALDDESLLLIFSRFHHHYASKFPGKIRNLGCTAAHLCYVAMGRADAAVVRNESYKDLAAAHIIVEAAGGGIFPLEGGEFHISDYLDGQKIEGALLVTTAEKREAVMGYLQKGG